MMSSRQYLQTRGRRSSTGTASLSVPLEYELYRVRQQEVAQALAVVETQLSEVLSILCHPGSSMTVHCCDVVTSVFQQVQQVVGDCLDVLIAPSQAVGLRPSHVLLKLSGLYRQLTEALVLAKNVRGLCMRGRLVTHDTTGAYASLRLALRTIREDARTLTIWLALGGGKEPSCSQEKLPLLA